MNFTKILVLLGLSSLTLKDGKADIPVDETKLNAANQKLEAISAMAEKADALQAKLDELKASLSAKDTFIQALEAEKGELINQNAALSAKVSQLEKLPAAPAAKTVTTQDAVATVENGDGITASSLSIHENIALTRQFLGLK